MSNTPVKLSISNYLNKNSVSDYLTSMLGEKKNEFAANLISLSETNTDLSNCDPGSLIKCAMNATALNLPLNKNLGYAYIIPFKNKRAGTTEPQFQLGYKGFIQLAIRTGQYKTISASEVREGEIERNKFTGEIRFLKEVEEGPVIGYISYIRLINGFEQSLFMSVAQVKAHAQKYSKSYAYDVAKGYTSSLWSNPDMFDSMAKKTVLKLLLSKYGVLSTEMQTAVEVDQQVNGEYADNPKSDRSSEEAVIVQDDPVVEQGEPTETAAPKTFNLNGN